MKKIILSLFMIATALICSSYVYGIKPKANVSVSYIAASDSRMLKAKIKFYNTKGQDENKREWNDNLNREGKGYITTKTPWNKNLYTSYYLKYIWKEILNGQFAFCLDPGLEVADNYKLVSTYQKKFNELDKNEKIHAVIYNADFSKLYIKYKNSNVGIPYDRSLTVDENTEYAIKQLLFWAYESYKSIFSFSEQFINGNFVGKVNISNIDVEVGSFSYKSNDILTEDIYAAVLHYNTGYCGLKHLAGMGTSQDDGKEAKFSYSYNGVGNYAGGLITVIGEILSESYDKLKKENLPVTIAKYTPTNGNTANFQEFIGIYVPPTENTNKKYAIVTNKSGIKSVYKNYTAFSKDTSISAPNVGDTYKYKSYNVYKSVSGYDGPIDLANNVTSSSSNTSSTYSINYKDAAEYNVIVFNYEYNPGTLTVEKRIRYGNGSVSGVISSYTEELSKNRNVNLSESLTYNSTKYEYFKYIKNGSTTYWNTSGTQITVPKSTSNVKITIYYGLRYIDYAHYLNSGNTYSLIDPESSITRYDNWNKVDNLLSAKSTPLYISKNSTYLKLAYINGKYKTKTTTVSASEVRTSGTIIGSSFSLPAMSVGDNDSTRVEFYYKVVPSTKVVIRHFTKQGDGTYKLNNNLSNSRTIVQNNEKAYGNVGKNSYVYVNNGYSQRKSVVKNSLSTLTSTEILSYVGYQYSEFYEIDKSDKILIDRSRNLISDGIYYKCIGYKTKSTNSNVNDLVVSKSGVNTTSSLRKVISGGNNNEYVYIDYYYDPENYSENAQNSIGSSARLKYITKSSSDYTSLGTNNSVVISTKADAKESDNIAYVPVTENLKPYVVTEICRPRTVKYDISLNNNNMVYGLSEYKAWGVSNSGNLASVTADTVVGTGEDKVYNSQAIMNFSNVGNINNSISNSKDKLKNVEKVFTGNSSEADNHFKQLLKNVTELKTKESDYSDNAIYNVPSDKYNGLRTSSGNISYKIYDILSNNSGSITPISISQNNSMSINVYTPVAVADSTIKSINFVNHSDVENSNTGIIQQGVEFSITVSTENKTYPDSLYNNIKTTGKYVKNWYLKFDFDVEYNGKSYSAADSEYICVPASHNDNLATTTISGLKAISSDKESLTNSIKNNVKVIASTINMPDNPVGTYADSKIKAVEAKKSSNGTERISVGYIGKGTTSDLGIPNASYYLVSKLKRTTTIGRIFDFEITDCLDVNFKDVFRNINSNDNTVNALTGTRYFSGIRRLLVTDSITSTTTNNIVQRSNLVVGTVAKIIPVGPYKHTSNSYIQAVKLGYRFSFDVKTSGYYNASSDNDVTRSIKITPSYYYISKDGSKYINNIKLYYKNSSGKYVDFENSNYTIYYKPDDGYRNLYNSSLYTGDSDVSKTSKDGNTTLTNTLVALRLGNKSGFYLKDNGSMTTSDQGFLQAWYGEFKIPNSTIALEVDSNGKIDINSPLTDGYIGVKFKLECIDTYMTEGSTTPTEVKISYDNNDKGIGNNAVNTTQWDYEGYLGFSESNIGKNLESTIKIQLEKGVWKIDSQSLYEKVKGTVIFYDIDNKAADDYN